MICQQNLYLFLLSWSNHYFHNVSCLVFAGSLWDNPDTWRPCCQKTSPQYSPGPRKSQLVDPNVQDGSVWDVSSSVVVFSIFSSVCPCEVTIYVGVFDKNQNQDHHSSAWAPQTERNCSLVFVVEMIGKNNSEDCYPRKDGDDKYLALEYPPLCIALH